MCSRDSHHNLLGQDERDGWLQGSHWENLQNRSKQVCFYCRYHPHGNSHGYHGHSYGYHGYHGNSYGYHGYHGYHKGEPAKQIQTDEPLIVSYHPDGRLNYHCQNNYSIIIVVIIVVVIVVIIISVI